MVRMMIFFFSLLLLVVALSCLVEGKLVHGKAVLIRSLSIRKRCLCVVCARNKNQRV